MLELVVGCVLLSAFLLGALPVITWIRASQTSAEAQRIAALELANQMERVAAMPAAQRTPETLNQLPLSAEAQSLLDDASLSAQIKPSETFSGLRQVQLSLAWTDSNGQRVSPVQLTAWFDPDANTP